MSRILLADDHPLFRAALAAAVGRVAPDRTVVETSSLAETATALQAGAAELVCLDLHMEDSSGFVGLAELRRAYPNVPVVVISASTAPGVAARALEFGASGFIPKTAGMDTLCEALQAILDGEIWAPEDDSEEADEAAEAAAKLAQLTPAQLRVMQGLAAGRLNKQIAYDMGISEATVKAHVTAIFRKLDVINRTQAVLVAQALLVEPPTDS
ncbi:response regulator transcription factor [Maricaulaceae bacterium NA33B04]|nr:response regulator transcription factor [Maricaulaceae bacterium NA33B04]